MIRVLASNGAGPEVSPAHAWVAATRAVSTGDTAAAFVVAPHMLQAHPGILASAA